MIDGLRDYVLHITATALICSVILRLTHGSGAAKMLTKLLCGIVLSYSIIQPVKQLDISKLAGFTLELRAEADKAVREGTKESQTAWTKSITQGAEAYILDKANALNMDLFVEVELSDDEIPVPVSVSLTGNAAPYAKALLSDTIANDLNIPKEKQKWISR